MKVLLEDDTVGTVFGEYYWSEGDYCTVSLTDENGNPIVKNGKIKLILED